MNYRRLGRSALQVSELCLGTMNFGPRTEKQVAFDLLDRAVAAGVNFIDTANQYGGDLGVGATERILGEWLAQNRSNRSRLIIATKVHEPMSADINDRGLSARHIQAACDASLTRLGVDHIDLYQMHHIDRCAPADEIWQAVERLISQGKITYVGSSNFAGWHIARMNETATVRRQLGLISEQSLYNLFERRAELEVLPACRAYGVGVIPWSPLAGGLLAGSSDVTGRRQSADTIKTRHQHASQIDGFETLCAQHALPPSRVALAWLLHQPGVSSTIIGPATVEQLQDALKVPETKLTDEIMLALDALFPPCGAAPEAYAW